MTKILPTIAAYVPPCIIQATLQETAPAPPTDATSEQFAAAILFADVSGFTPLTEALAQKGSEGPEELTRLLNGYFSRMIAIIESEGGEVVKFSGDAMTAVFRAQTESLSAAVRRAKQAADAMQAAMTEFATLQTSVGSVALGMKIGVAAGEILSAQVGGGEGRWEYVIAGDPLRQVAEAEHQAQRGEIILSPEAEAVISQVPVPPQPLPQPNWAQVGNPKAVADSLRAFVPRSVLGWLDEGLQDWLAVLRPMSVLFVGVEGIDYEQPDAIAKLHTFLRQSQSIIARYEGSINKLAVDDKGTIMLPLFGAPPFAHEDDPERALRCAMDLQALAQTLSLQLAIGVTTGRVFAGPVGSATRREYTVMGDTVNLAARLMSVAGPSQIRCDYETYRWTRHKLAFKSLPSVSLKGKAGLIRVYKPTGEADKRVVEKGGALFGRAAELARLTDALEMIQSEDGRPLCIFIEGDAGIGKSRLVEEMVRLMRERGLSGLRGMGRSIERQTPYRVWRDIFSSYFGLDDIDDTAVQRRLVREKLHVAAPHMAERLPLLNDVLNIGLPENALTRSLDAHLRHESLVSLLISLLYAWTADRPLVIVLEDAQWLDSLSWDLALQVLRGLSIARVPLFMTIAIRPLTEDDIPAEAHALASMEMTERIVLDPLTAAETLALAAARLGLAGELPPPVAALIEKRASGNPFFAEELVHTLRDNNLITIETEAGRTVCRVNQALDQAAQTLPDTIEGIVLSRIDRLPPETQLTLKVAAVIGRTFAYLTLRDTLGGHMEITNRLLQGYLDNLAQLNLAPVEAPEPEMTYIFKHIITQEVAYESLLFAQRRQLHTAVARWFEQEFGRDSELPTTGQLETPLAPYYPLLVYHWNRAENDEKERIYARLAGQWAAAQFANVEAAGYFSRALALTPETDLTARYELLLAREAVNDLRGERETQGQDLAALTALTAEMADGRRQAEVDLRQASYYQAISDYAQALQAAQKAIAHIAATQDNDVETKAYIALGRVLWRQGAYEKARERLAGALALARRHGFQASEGKSLNTLGHVHLYQGDLAEAGRHYRQALEIYRAYGDRQGEADNLSNLGVVHYESGERPEARDYLEQALTIYRTIGDRRGETLTLNNLGNVYCDLGDYAAALTYHQQALDLRLTIGDREGEAASLVNLGLVNHGLGDYAASRTSCLRALAIQNEIGDQRGQGYSLTYLGHALTGLGALAAAADAYTNALNLRRDLGQESLAIDDLAGLARVALADSNYAQAAVFAADVLDWINTSGTDGIEYPLQALLTCYAVLQATAAGNTAVFQQANTILSQAHADLQKQAAGISDATLRDRFLNNVAVHRDILAAWDAASAA